MKKSTLAMMVLILVAAAGCRKDRTLSDEVVEAVREYSTTSKIFNEVANTGDDVLDQAEQNSKGRIDSGNSNKPVITISPADLTTFPKTTTVDFGAGFTGLDGVERKGKIKIVSTAWRKKINSVHTMTFENYYQNGNKIEGTHIATNVGKEEGDRTFLVEVPDGRITTKEGRTLSFVQKTTRTRIAGEETPFNIWDNEYSIEGSQSGISSGNVSYSMMVSETLKFKAVPRGFYAGIALMDIGSYKGIILNYNEKKITINGNAYSL